MADVNPAGPHSQPSIFYECQVCLAPMNRGGVKIMGHGLCDVCLAWYVEQDDGPTAELHLRALRRFRYFGIECQVRETR